MMKSSTVAVAATLALSALSVSGASAATTNPTRTAGEHQFVVLYADGATFSAARAAVVAAGGTIVTENTDVGVATVVTTNSGFAASADAQAALAGTAKNRVIGDLPHDRNASGGPNAGATGFDFAHPRVAAAGSASADHRTEAGAEPLAHLQWDMQQIDATVDGSYRYEPGDKGVVVGVLDTGIDGTHPDIQPNFNDELSRNFTVDIPVDASGAPIDGPCEDEPDRSCEDPANVDEDGHGTHVASTIGSPINGIGIAGVAPNVSLVSLRAGQDSGYFFLQPSIDALTYAGKNGVDVVNMSYFVDPWLFNCTNHPADSPADRQEQATIITAMQRALDFARSNGVTLVSAAGNEASDYTKVLTDESSPDFADAPGEIARTRDLLDPESCVSMPSEGTGVITVSSTGPSERKAVYSNYGNGFVDVAAPGGDEFDTPGGDPAVTTQILAAYPESLAIAKRQLDAGGDPTAPDIVKSCDETGEVCGYYQYLQGTSMASPHAAGVAALIVSRYGSDDDGRGLTMSPDEVGARLAETATATPCPTPAEFGYTIRIAQPDGTIAEVVITATCEGDAERNGFYGYGIINARAAVGE